MLNLPGSEDKKASGRGACGRVALRLGGELRSNSPTVIVVTVVSLLVLLVEIRADEPHESPPEQLSYFETKIRPLLVNHCCACHGEELAEGNLRLDSRSGWERGGERGPAIVPGDPSSSLLIRAVTYRDEKLQMPPKASGGKLSDVEIEDLTTWIRQGAHDPRSGEKVITDIEKAAREHWAFQPVAAPGIEGDDHPIDTLIER